MEIILQSDKELVQRTLSGQSVAYEALFERHRYAILSMLMARCHQEAICDDILQEAFIKAYLNLDKFNSEYSFAQWIMTIARNLFIDYVRRKGDDSDWLDVASCAAVCSQPNPEERCIVTEDNRRLDIALSKLTPAYRQIIEMRFWRDLTYEQIACELDMPLGTVKTQIFRARRVFIALLG